MFKTKQAGFTLVEILIAMFIFTIISLMMLGGMRIVISAQSGTDKNAERLRQTQMALLMLSRDLEQTVDRPIIATNGREEPAFIGTAKSITFTHAGVDNPQGMVLRSHLARTEYTWHDDALWRASWNVLDQAPTSRPHSRQILPTVTAANFQYLDKDGRFQPEWPTEKRGKQALPRAVRVSFTIASWGEISQLYVIPTSIKPTQPSA